jgi:polyhydroxyalkanoate synthesis repressor PhaR
MIRVVKRYGSRKLYDTEESRYVSLEEIGDWVRDGQEVRVVDNTTEEDVTAQTLMQVILDGGKRGTSLFTSDILHDLIRRGERVVNSGVEHLQEGVGRLLDASLDRIGPLRRVREEAEQLRDRLARLEETIAELESEPAGPAASRPAARVMRPHGSTAKSSQATARKAKAARTSA